MNFNKGGVVHRDEKVFELFEINLPYKSDFKNFLLFFGAYVLVFGGLCLFVAILCYFA